MKKRQLSQIFGCLKIAILKTPPHPQQFLFLFLFLFSSSLFCTNLKAQKILLTISSYEESLKHYHNKKWTAERIEFMSLNKKSILYFLPSVGLQFGLPSISWNPLQILEYKNQKKVTFQKLKSLDLKHHLEFNEALLELRILYYQIQQQEMKIKHYEDVLKLDYKSFEAIKEGFEARELDPISFREQEKEMLKRKQDLYFMKSDLQLKILEIERFSKFKLPEQSLFYEDSKGCFLEN